MAAERPPRVLLGVCGGIAASKAPQIVRALRARGAEVRCVLTRAAESFVAPLTLEVLSGSPLWGDEYLRPNGSGEELHLTAANWAEVVCIAPATAHTLARLALGLADDFLTTTLLASRAPCVLAPAMHEAMWHHPAVVGHVAELAARGVELVGPVHGPLASGELGMGRMAEPEAIAEAVLRRVRRPLDFVGARFVVSAGPTQEPIDPVRYLGNRSTGKMGFAIAAEAARRGAEVTLVAGPVALATPTGVRRRDVTTALEMQAAMHAEVVTADVIVMTAAVADFRVAAPAEQKIKKDQGPPSLELVANPDILAGLRDHAPQALIVGFAAETEQLEAHALAKLARKRIDLLVANDVSRRDIGFGAESNEVRLFGADGSRELLTKREKSALAGDLLDRVRTRLASRRG
jgi:phosphopantothenoylcysteine decarboxylase/phosphopantothenate--cysteine ligase